MTSRRAHLGTALSACGLVAALLAAGGCGGADKGDDEPQAAASASPTATPTVEESDPPEPPEPTGAATLLQKPKADQTIKPRASLTAVPGASLLPAGRERPRTIQGFPVPAGAKVKDPGPIDETWQFDIHSDDLDGVIAFYKRVLPQMGYTVRTNVTYEIGYEKVNWDVVFDGKVSGSMVRDPDNGVVFVVVNPPGQPAFAGDEG